MKRETREEREKSSKKKNYFARIFLFSTVSLCTELRNTHFCVFYHSSSQKRFEHEYERETVLCFWSSFFLPRREAEIYLTRKKT
jgi:hypothetical protein